MKTKSRHPLFLIAFGVTLFAALLNLSTIFAFVKNVFSIISPVVVGFILAFILNVPMKGFEKIINTLIRKLKKKPSDKIISFISLMLTFIALFLIVYLVITSIIPTISESLINLYDLGLNKLPELKALLKEQGVDSESILGWIDSLNIEKVLKNVSNNAGSFISNIFTFITTAASEVVNFLISLIIAVYTLLCKKDLCRQAHKLADAHLKPSIKEYLFHVGNLINDTYSKFLSGQCVEACILGTLIGISYSIAGIPYAILIGVLTTIFAFIPFVGAFLSCLIGVILVSIASPAQVPIAIIIYLVVQFVETQFIYPHVVGTSVGLSSLWTLIAVLIGGNLFGVMGIIFFIPITAVIISLLKDHTNKLLERKAKLSNKNSNKIIEKDPTISNSL